MGKKELTKQRIIDTAIKLISSHGFNATTTALIAKELGLSEAIIFKYYGDKQNLLRHIGKLAADQIFENIALIPFLKNVEAAKEYPLREFLRSIALERLEFVEQNFELIKILMVEMQYSEDLLQLAQKRVYAKAYEAAGAIQQIFAAKTGISEQRARVIFRMWLGAFLSIVIQKFLLQVEFQPGEIDAELEDVLDAIESLVELSGPADSQGGNRP
ncbi:TetR family transcriptional regulator [Hydrogenispora ethanolica]|uniref:TetR family transcriptional regulator n=1 Tax=Hydrogenispora ethanolica TaxID=1082276 RepID=A0A4R1SB25_HYDET|nr:TetR/AcrR family transcriptional regulator [Hydrogenispora ethanolica]TCL76444.1 TetR family transcriptional regulator [Hydrogenispora ethanolica]